MTTKQWIFHSKIGVMYLVASDIGLQGLFWKQQSAGLVKSYKDSPFLIQAVQEISEYLEGTRKSFTIPLDIQGTDFQKKVWNQLTKIAYGKTTSYKDLAFNVKNENASRAVGTANGKNPLSIIIPCHRVIASTGALSGYAGGLPMKKILLDLEKAALGELQIRGE